MAGWLVLSTGGASPFPGEGRPVCPSYFPLQGRHRSAPSIFLWDTREGWVGGWETAACQGLPLCPPPTSWGVSCPSWCRGAGGSKGNFLGGGVPQTGPSGCRVLGLPPPCGVGVFVQLLEREREAPSQPLWSQPSLLGSAGEGRESLPPLLLPRLPAGRALCCKEGGGRAGKPRRKGGPHQRRAGWLAAGGSSSPLLSSASNSELRW